MKLFVIFAYLLALEAVQAQNANLTAWRHHRRQKRFLIYQNGGVVKFVTGIAFPVDFQEKNPWRQLVWLMNYHYQFPEPQTPIYWWTLWNSSRDLKGPLQLSTAQRRQHLQLAKQKELELPVVDEPQKLLYELAVEYMNQRGQPGRACLERIICENAQVDEHSGLYAELLHRLLRPHKSLDQAYGDAFTMGKHRVNCRSAYPEASYCVLDDYVHVHERGLSQSYV